MNDGTSKIFKKILFLTCVHRCPEMDNKIIPAHVFMTLIHIIKIMINKVSIYLISLLTYSILTNIKISISKSHSIGNRDKWCKTKSVGDIAIAFCAINMELKCKQIHKKVSKNLEIVKNTHLKKSLQTLSSWQKKQQQMSAKIKGRPWLVENFPCGLELRGCLWLVNIISTLRVESSF